ncbi:MAG: hypothetical protein IIW79_00595 [Clostridia bacterium]|nr:hypothetical protein [Clostridia bacterium]
MEKGFLIRGLVSRGVLFAAGLSIIFGSFMYGRIIGFHYRDTIEVTVATIYDDIVEMVEEGREYLYEVLGLAENPK